MSAHPRTIATEPVIVYGVDRKYWSWLLLVSIIIVCFHHYVIGADYLYFGTVPIGVLFYLLGFYCRNIQFNDKLFLCSTLLYIGAFIFSPTCYDMFYNAPVFGQYIPTLLLTFPGLILINNVFYRVKCMNFTILQWFGRNAMPYLLLHVPIILVVRSYHRYMNCYSYTSYLIQAFVSICVCTAFALFIYKKQQLRFLIGG